MDDYTIKEYNDTVLDLFRETAMLLSQKYAILKANKHLNATGKLKDTDIDYEKYNINYQTILGIVGRRLLCINALILKHKGENLEDKAIIKLIYETLALEKRWRQNIPKRPFPIGTKIKVTGPEHPAYGREAVIIAYHDLAMVGKAGYGLLQAKSFYPVNTFYISNRKDYAPA